MAQTRYASRNLSRTAIVTTAVAAAAAAAAVAAAAVPLVWKAHPASELYLQQSCGDGDDDILYKVY